MPPLAVLSFSFFSFYYLSLSFSFCFTLLEGLDSFLLLFLSPLRCC